MGHVHLDLGSRVVSADHDEPSHSTPAEQIVMDYAPRTARAEQVETANNMGLSWQKEIESTTCL